MSQFPSMNQPGSDPYNPFSASPMSQPPPRKSNTWLYILLGAGGVGLLLCCGCGGFFWFAFNTGMGMISTNVKNQLNVDPVAQQHLGTVETVEMDWGATIEAAGKHQGREVIAFRVEGSAGSGVVIGDSPQGGAQNIRNASLLLPSGEEVALGF